MVAASVGATLAVLRYPSASGLCLHWQHRSLLLPHVRVITSRQFDFHQSRTLCSHRKAKIFVLRSTVKSEVEVDDEACELVNGTELLIGENDESIHAYLFTAVKNNNGIGLLLLTDYFGFEDSSTRDFAYRLACNGFNVLVPDLFHGDPWKKELPEAEFNHWLARQQTERVAKDIELSKDWLIDEFSAAGLSKKFGVIGFGSGGLCSIETLSKDDDSHFGTAVCFYGTDMSTALAEDIKVPVLFICGDNDPHCPRDLVSEMQKRINGSKAVIYDGRGHGFAHRPESQEDDRDAEDAFNIMRSWLNGFLVSQEDTL